MKKLLLLFVLGYLSASFASDTCYSVELWSVKYSNPEPLQTEAECKVLDIGAFRANRCGCFVDIVDAKDALTRYKLSYPKAYVTKTLRSRFEKPLTKTVTKKKEKSKELNAVLSFKPSEYLQTTADINTFQYEEELKKNNTKISQSYNEVSNFYGLSLEGKYEQYINQNYVMRDYTDFEYELKLKFSLFKDGFFAHKKENKREEKTAQVVYLQNLSVVLKNSYSDRQLMIKGLQSEIDYNYYLKLANLYQNVMKQNEKKLHNGIIQSYRYDELNQTQQRFLKFAKIYKQHKRVTIDKKMAALLDEIGQVELKKIDTITQYSQKNNHDIALSRAQMDTLDASKSYMDTVNMNLYAHRRKVDELGWYNTIGAEAKFPLDFSSQEESEIDKLKQNSYTVVNKSLEKNIKNRLGSLYLDFQDLQGFIEIDKSDVSYLTLRIQKFEDIQKNIVPNLTYEPDEEILIARQKIIELKRKILLSKINLFKILNEITFIANIDDISNILKPKSRK